MTRPLDVLVIESHPGVAASAVHALEAAGHHVQRCYDDDSLGFPCRGVIDPAECPLARHSDVALLVRGRVAPRPTELEQGASCALRAGVPLVEDGPAALDPFEPWLAARVDDSVVNTCEAASDTALGELRRPISAPGILTISARPCGNGRVSSGRSKLRCSVVCIAVRLRSRRLHDEPTRFQAAADLLAGLAA
jgi:hypothetical protein